MFVELAFMACLAIGIAEKCESKSMLFTDITPMTCLMIGQAELAKWAEQHPGWEIQSWRCGSPSDEREA